MSDASNAASSFRRRICSLYIFASTCGGVGETERGGVSVSHPKTARGSARARARTHLRVRRVLLERLERRDALVLAERAEDARALRARVAEDRARDGLAEQLEQVVGEHGLLRGLRELVVAQRGVEELAARVEHARERHAVAQLERPVVAARVHQPRRAVHEGLRVDRLVVLEVPGARRQERARA